MSDLLGWVRAGTAPPADNGLRLLEGELVSRVHETAPSATARERLTKLQECHRNFDAFLPHVTGADTPEDSKLRARMDRLAGFGQLCLCLSQPPRADMPKAATGRGYLRRRRNLRARDAEWRAAAEKTLLSLARSLPARGHRLRKGASTVALDLLIPSKLETGIRNRLTGLIGASGFSVFPGRLAASGLWVPLSFADGGERGDA